LYDVAVIGGGPTGSQVACRLAEMGYQVVVVEQKVTLAEPVCCTGIISEECVDAFAIDERVILRRVNSARVFSPSGRLLKLWRPESQACVVDRAAFNVSLADRARDRGVEYILNCSVKGLEVGNNRVRVDVELPGRAPDCLEARAGVVATGSGSKLIEKIGLGKTGDFVSGVQAEVDTENVDEVEVYLGRGIAPGFFGWLVPTLPGKALVGLLARRTPGSHLREFMSALVVQGRIASADVKLSYNGVLLKPLARTYGERLVVVGSAAGQVKPTTGGGIYYGLLCANIAANHLHRALTGDTLSAGNLAGYEKEWKKELGWELKTGYWARRVYELLNDRQLDRVFDLINSNGILETLLEASDLSFDWHGSVVLRLLGHRALSQVVKATKLPLPSRRR